MLRLHAEGELEGREARDFIRPEEQMVEGLDAVLVLH
jgi:hypothetical protein